MKTTHLPEESKELNKPITKCLSDLEQPEKNTSYNISGRERLKRHREEVAGKVRIPENWGKEGLMKGWMDLSVFDGDLTFNQIILAQAALMENGVEDTRRGASRQRLGVESSC